MSPDEMLISRTLCEMQGKHALVIGDVMLDQFIDGQVKRISPEAPVPVLSTSNVWQIPGGAANVACNLGHLGLRVTLTGVIGDDETGDALQAALASLDAVTFWPQIETGRVTSKKTRFRSAGQQILRVDDETTAPVTDKTASALLDTITQQCADADIIIISDYAKGCLTDDVLRGVITAASAAGVPVIADPKRASFAAYGGVNLLTPNMAELRAETSLPTDTDFTSISAIAAATAALATTSNIGQIMLTMSADGMLLVNQDGTHIHAAATAREVFDVSGAGDTVIATLAAALAAGGTAENAIAIANIAAGVAVEKSGTSIVAPGEILGALSLPTPPTDHAHWASICQDWRTENQKIGFANGCFDLLHPGHLHLLRAASQQCDKLIVGLNGDASVRRLKGASRPLQSAEQRAAILASLPFIDGVAIFDQDTPLDVITALQPDYIIKGGDYAADDVVGGDVVRARGGEVIIIPTFGTHSTSAIAGR